MLIESIISLVAKLGGFTVVVGAICKVFVDWYLKRKTAQYEKEIEILKHQLSSEIEKSKSLNEQVSYKNKLLFDEEVSIYKEISPYVNNVKEILLSFIVNRSVNNEDNLVTKMLAVEKAIDDLRNKLNVNTFFIDEEIHSSIKNYLKTSSDVLDKVIYNYQSCDKNTEMKKVVDQYDIIKNVIRTYLAKKAELY